MRLDDLGPNHIEDEALRELVKDLLNVLEAQQTEIKAYLKSNQVSTEIYYPCPMHLQECFADLGHQSVIFLKVRMQLTKLCPYPFILS